MTTPNDDQPAPYSCAKTGCLHDTLAARLAKAEAERDVAVAENGRLKQLVDDLYKDRSRGI